MATNKKVIPETVDRAIQPNQETDRLNKIINSLGMQVAHLTVQLSARTVQIEELGTENAALKKQLMGALSK